MIAQAGIECRRAEVEMTLPLFRRANHPHRKGTAERTWREQKRISCFLHMKVTCLQAYIPILEPVRGAIAEICHQTLVRTRALWIKRLRKPGTRLHIFSHLVFGMEVPLFP